METFRAAMSRAIDLSRSGLGRTGANPIVGAVVATRSGDVIAEGFHAGGDHAEVIALRAYASSSQKSAHDVLVVTLEPCNHHGKTPPCVDAIIASGIKEVIFAVADPNPIAAGGTRALQQAGVTVRSGLMADEAAWSNRAWLTRIEKKRPFYTWKIAMTLDGKTSAPDSSSKWITSAASRAKVSELRRHSDAIVVGTATVLADNPSLLPHDDVTDHQPLRVVVGEREIASSAQVNDDRAETYFYRSHDLPQLSSVLLEKDITRVLVESGSTLASAMMQAGMIDEVIAFVAPSVLGAGKTFFTDSAISTLSQKRELRLLDHQVYGEDVALHYAVVEGGR